MGMKQDNKKVKIQAYTVYTTCITSCFENSSENDKNQPKEGFSPPERKTQNSSIFSSVNMLYTPSSTCYSYGPLSTSAKLSLNA